MKMIKVWPAVRDAIIRHEESGAPIAADGETVEKTRFITRRLGDGSLQKTAPDWALGATAGSTASTPQKSAPQKSKTK